MIQDTAPLHEDSCIRRRHLSNASVAALQFAGGDCPLPFLPAAGIKNADAQLPCPGGAGEVELAEIPFADEGIRQRWHADR